MVHHHHHHHEVSPSDYNFAFAVAVILNLAFVLVEGGYAIAANSMSLLADAVHNLGDVMGLALAWLANYLLTKGSSERYSYGFKKTSVIAALVNALLLVATSAVIAYESISKLLNPESVHELTVIIVALIGIAINGGTALLFMKDRHHDLNIKGAFLHLAADALISLGVVLTGVVILYKQWLWLDPTVGLLIVVTILFGTWGLLRESLNMILDAVPKEIDQQGVKEYLQAIPGVAEVHDLHIWCLSTRENALTAHLKMPKKHLSDEDYIRINKYLHDQFKIQHVTLQVETGDGADVCGQAESCD